MSTEVRSLYVVLSATTAAFTGGMVKAGAEVTAFGRAVQATSAQNAAFRKGLSTTALVAGGALLLGLGLSIKAHTEMQEKMLQVATISSEVAGNLQGYTDSLVAMSLEVPQTATQLAEGLYDIVSSGFDGAEALQILDVAARGAAAGLTDTATSARVILSALNAYGLEASAAGDVSDILFQTVNKGVVTFEELSGVLGKVMPTAAAAKVSLDEVGSAMAALTLSGLSPEEAATSLGQTMNKILAPGTAMQHALADIGQESGSAALETLGLKGTIDALAKSQGTAADTALRLFPEIRAAKGYLALTAAEGRNYASTFDSISDAVGRAGASSKAFETTQEANAAAGRRIAGQMQALAIQTGQVIEPITALVLDMTEAFVGMLGAMPGPVKTTVVALAGLLAISLLVSGGFLKMQTQMVSFRAGLAATRSAATMTQTVMAGLKLAMGFVGVALIAATAIYSVYSAQKREAKQVTDDFVQALKSEQGGVENASLDTLAKMLTDSGAIDRLKDAGVDYTLVIAGIRGDTEAWAEAQKQLNDAVDAAIPEADRGNLHDEAMASISDEVLATQDLQKEMEDLRDGYSDAAQVVKEFGEAQKEVGKAADRQADGLTRLENRFAPVIDGTREYDETTKALNKTVASFEDPMNALQASLKDGESSLRRFTRELAKQVTDMQNFMSNLAVLAAQGRAGLAAEFAAMGPQAAGLVADAVDASGKELNRLEKLMGTKATLSTVAFSQGLQALPAIAASKGKMTVREFADSFTGGDMKAAQSMLRILRQAVEDVPTRKLINMVLKGDKEAKTGADQVLKGLQAVQQDWNPSLHLKGDEQLIAEAAAAKRALENLRDKTVTITTKIRRIGGSQPVPNADGGIWTFAGGGIAEQHRAGFYGAGTNRLFAEGETGGEAYVPMSIYKRSSAMGVMKEVANRFGYDMRSRGSQGGSSVTVIQKLPDKMTLVVDGSTFTAYVRGQATSVANNRDNAQDLTDDTSEGMNWK